MKTTRPHKNLKAWQESMILVTEIYKLTQTFPKEELYGITSQIRRAAISVASNIAEGAARSTQKEFYQFLSIASGSLSEVDTHLEITYRLKYISKEFFEKTLSQIEKCSALLNGLKKSLKT